VIGVKIRILLGIPYRDILNKNDISIDLDLEEALISDVFEEVFNNYPYFKEELKGKNLLNSAGEPKALFIVDGCLITADYNFNSDCEIRMLYPLAGG
jgi:hypothetical protein